VRLRKVRLEIWGIAEATLARVPSTQGPILEMTGKNAAKDFGMTTVRPPFVRGSTLHVTFLTYITCYCQLFVSRSTTTEALLKVSQLRRAKHIIQT
jgi:hypothetical protein